MLSAIVKPFAILVALLVANAAHAHGAIVALAEVQAISVTARYDTGEVMGNAQVMVFAPDDPAQPWLTGQTDAAGQFSFTPDDRAGRWAVQVRAAGHGAISYVDIATGGTATITPAATGLTVAQKALMLASVLWGAVGTALYFRRPRAATVG